MTIKAEIILDSVSPDNIRLTTMRLRYPKYIHGEFMTHRVFSRNASSSRAIPVDRTRPIRRLAEPEITRQLQKRMDSVPQDAS